MLPLFVSLLVKLPYGKDEIFASFRWNPKYKPSVKIEYVWSHPCEAGFHRKRNFTRQRRIWLRVILNREDFNFLAVRLLFIFQGGACAFLIYQGAKDREKCRFLSSPIYTYLFFRENSSTFLFVYKKFINSSKKPLFRPLYRPFQAFLSAHHLRNRAL